MMKKLLCAMLGMLLLLGTALADTSDQTVPDASNAPVIPVGTLSASIVQYETIDDGSLDCDYFLDCVLPADWSLNDLVAYAMWYDEDSDDAGLPARMKRCAMCREPFTVTNNRQRYCPTCAGIVSRQQAAIRKRRSRNRK